MKFEDKVKGLREKKYKGRETPELLLDIAKMTEGEAYEYLLGEVLFCGVRVDLSLRPMIPRPETEFWLRHAFTFIEAQGSVYSMRVLDLFSGSGNIGLATLKHFPEAMVDMIELDPRLKEQIEISITKNNIRKTRTRVLIGDTWEGAQGTYDYIFAVPPYVPFSMKEEVMQELSAEEPLSFFDKEDGYYYHKQILAHASEFLKQKGILFLEFDVTQHDTMTKLVTQYGYTIVHSGTDPYGHVCAFGLAKQN